MTVIEKGIPMAPSGASYARYPWDKMEIGDSFLARPGSNGRALAVNATAARPGKKFACRVNGGIHRVWRTA